MNGRNSYTYAVDVKNVFTVLLAGGRGQRLDPLTRDRAKPAVPFGGTYRIIDFTLSNCLNSKLPKILVLVQYRSRSLSQHIRHGWSHFFNNAKNEFIETLPPQQTLGDRWYEGTADAVFQNLFAIREENPSQVLIVSGDHIYKMDYRRMLQAHEDTAADLTVAAVEVPTKEASSFGILQVDQDSKIVKFSEKPKKPTPTPDDSMVCLASMGIYVFRTEALEKALADDAKSRKSSHDFGKDILPRMIGKYSTYAFRFVDQNKQATKYWRDVGTIDAYYAANMDLISPAPHLDLYDHNWRIWRRATMAPPPKFVFNMKKPETRIGAAFDSLVAPGCIISGGIVRRSILSPYVRVHSYSQVEDSILFQNVSVGRRAKIRRAIIDKDVRIPEGMKIGYDLKADRKRFTVSKDGIVVISKRAVI